MMMSRHTAILQTIPFLIAVCLSALPAQAKYSGGTGEPNDAYQIATAADLIALGETPADYDKHFLLTADIDLDPNLPGRKVFDKAVIAPDTDPNDEWGEFQGTLFTGVFDGDGHTISHLTIMGESWLGLFGQLGSTASVSNVGLEAVDLSGTGPYIGGHGSGSYLGGLVGANYGTVTACYSTGAVNGTGGFVGGLAGFNDNGAVVQCHSTGTVNGTGEQSDCVGGLVGYNRGGSIVSSYSSGSVRGNSRVGGLVGWNYLDTLTDCYSTSAVSGKESVGGLAGSVNGSVSKCYSVGMVTGSQNVGGLVGAVGTGAYPRDITGVVTECFWDIQTSGQMTSAGGGTGLDTPEMQRFQTYDDAGWDLVGEIANGTHETWQMPQQGGYPTLTTLSGYAPAVLQGMGTSENPYLISNALELGAMVHYSPNACYRLAAPIDLSGIRWSVSVMPWFRGSFDGNGFIISHLHIQGGSYLGFFGQLSSTARISNLILEAVEVSPTGFDICVGGLVGLNSGGSIVRSCSSGSVVGTAQSVGGLVGSNGGSVSYCYSAGAVNGTHDVGGLVGSNYGSIATSHSSATSVGGGLVGWNEGSIATSYSSGAVRGGGLVGYNTNGSIVSSFWDTETSGQTTSHGGTGKTTAEMQTAATFLDAGWDFVGETANGSEDIWWILEGKDYPRLWWEAAEE